MVVWIKGWWSGDLGLRIWLVVSLLLVVRKNCWSKCITSLWRWSCLYVTLGCERLPERGELLVHFIDFLLSSLYLLLIVLELVLHSSFFNLRIIWYHYKLLILGVRLSKRLMVRTSLAKTPSLQTALLRCPHSI